MTKAIERTLLVAVSVIGGQVVGEVFEGQRRFPLQVRLAPAWREDLTTLEALTIQDPRVRRIPLSQLADIVVEDGPAEISRDAIRRRLLIAVPVTLLLIFSLFSMTFGSVSLTMLISLERRRPPPTPRDSCRWPSRGAPGPRSSGPSPRS
jgi:Cu/Ag efflux pump CusA